MQNDNLKSYLNLHLIVFIWGFTAILGALISLEALDLVWFRMVFAVIFIALYVFIKKNRPESDFPRFAKTPHPWIDHCFALAHIF